MAVTMKSAACHKMGVRFTSARLPLASRPALRSVLARQARDDHSSPEISATGDNLPLNIKQTVPSKSIQPIPDSSISGGAATAPWADVMGFFGAPEIINGRLAMLGFVAAMVAELTTGLPVTTQLSQTPMLILVVFGVFIAASLIPFFLQRKPEGMGPLNPRAELVNGRAAMIGCAALLAFEMTCHRALF